MAPHGGRDLLLQRGTCQQHDGICQGNQARDGRGASPRAPIRQCRTDQGGACHTPAGPTIPLVSPTSGRSSEMGRGPQSRHRPRWLCAGCPRDAQWRSGPAQSQQSNRIQQAANATPIPSISVQARDRREPDRTRPTATRRRSAAGVSVRCAAARCEPALLRFCGVIRVRYAKCSKPAGSGSSTPSRRSTRSAPAVSVPIRVAGTPLSR